MSKENGWIPIDKNLSQYLPNDGRPYTELEAMFSFTKDIDEQKEYSISGYAFLWNWSRTKVRKFIKDIQNIKGHLKNSKKTGKKQAIHFIDKELWVLKNGQKTIKKQQKNSTNNPNDPINPKTIIYPFSSDVFLLKWDSWKKYKKTEKKFSYKSEDSENLALKHLDKLADHNEENAIQIIEQSIANGWSGFFSLPAELNKNKSTYDERAGW